MTRDKKGKTLFGEEARNRIPKDKLYVMNVITGYFKEVLRILTQSNDINIRNEKEIYIYKYQNCSKYIGLTTIVYEGIKRDASCGVVYWEVFNDPRYNKMFSIDLSIDSEINFMLDYSIWILEYVYRNDPEFFLELFHSKEDRLVKWSRGTDVQYYCYFFFHSNEIEFVKHMIEKILQWLFNRKEIIEVLKGERWIEGYVPPTPY